MRFAAIFQRLLTKAWAVSASAHSHSALVSWRLRNSGLSGGGAVVSGAYTASGSTVSQASGIAPRSASVGGSVSDFPSLGWDVSLPESRLSGESCASGGVNICWASWAPASRTSLPLSAPGFGGRCLAASLEQPPNMRQMTRHWTERKLQTNAPSTLKLRKP